eukprot:scaffold15981_cov18-Prasinocladus_malaysianus.AAC.1
MQGRSETSQANCKLACRQYHIACNKSYHIRNALYGQMVNQTAVIRPVAGNVCMAMLRQFHIKWPSKLECDDGSVNRHVPGNVCMAIVRQFYIE